jgi:hypothetical protein
MCYLVSEKAMQKGKATANISRYFDVLAFTDYKKQMEHRFV